MATATATATAQPQPLSQPPPSRPPHVPARWSDKNSGAPPPSGWRVTTMGACEPPRGRPWVGADRAPPAASQPIALSLCPVSWSVASPSPPPLASARLMAFRVSCPKRQTRGHDPTVDTATVAFFGGRWRVFRMVFPTRRWMAGRRGWYAILAARHRLFPMPHGCQP